MLTKFDNWVYIWIILYICLIGIIYILAGNGSNSYCDEQLGVDSEYYNLNGIEPGYIQCCYLNYTNHIGNEVCEVFE